MCPASDVTSSQKCSKLNKKYFHIFSHSHRQTLSLIIIMAYDFYLYYAHKINIILELF